MGVSVVVLLFVATLALARPLTTGQGGVKRLLRTSTIEEHESEEERAAVSGFSKLKQTASGLKADVKIQTWLMSKKSLDDVFMKLKLNEAGPNLFKSPKLKTWVKYRQLYNKKNGIQDSSGINTFLRFYADTDLSMMIEAARKNPNTARIGNDLRAGQLSEWLRTKTDPRVIFNRLNVRGTAINDVNRVLWRKYLGEYNRIFILRRPREPQTS